jgi:hypothetical protein
VEEGVGGLAVERGLDAAKPVLQLGACRQPRLPDRRAVSRCRARGVVVSGAGQRRDEIVAFGGEHCGRAGGKVGRFGAGE